MSGLGGPCIPPWPSSGSSSDRTPAQKDYDRKLKEQEQAECKHHWETKKERWWDSDSKSWRERKYKVCSKDCGA